MIKFQKCFWHYNDHIYNCQSFSAPVFTVPPNPPLSLPGYARLLRNPTDWPAAGAGVWIALGWGNQEAPHFPHVQTVDQISPTNLHGSLSLVTRPLFSFLRWEAHTPCGTVWARLIPSGVGALREGLAGGIMTLTGLLCSWSRGRELWGTTNFKLKYHPNSACLSSFWMLK